MPQAPGAYSPSGWGAWTNAMLQWRMSHPGAGADETHPGHVARSLCLTCTHQDSEQQYQQTARRPEGAYHDPTRHDPRAFHGATAYHDPSRCPPLQLHRLGRGAWRPPPANSSDKVA